VIIPFAIIGGMFILSFSDLRSCVRYYLPAATCFVIISILAGVYAERVVDYAAWMAGRRLNIIEKLVHQQRLKEAYYQLNALLDDAPSVEGIFELAQFEYDITGNIPRAQELFAQCSRIAPNYPEPYYYAGGIALEHERDPPKALNLFYRYIEKRNHCGYRPDDHPGELLRALYYIALLNIQQGKPQPAIKALREAEKTHSLLPPVAVQRNEGLIQRLQKLEAQLD
jgi:tetratricopeptide (TPR) repeat protein